MPQCGSRFRDVESRHMTALPWRKERESNSQALSDRPDSNRGAAPMAALPRNLYYGRAVVKDSALAAGEGIKPSPTG